MGGGGRTASVNRETRETQISATLRLDGAGRGRVATTLPFLDHMLGAFAKHGGFDLTLTARGDTHVDHHHTVEDIGLVLGETIARCVGDKRGIARFGLSSVPMDDALATATVDVCGRPYLVYRVAEPRRKKILEFDTGLIEHFFRSLTTTSGLTLHINAPYGDDPHHLLEAIFKAFGRALSQAVRREGRAIASTKGLLA
ncbi:MAG: imidazoleglycerol-phosphate dehydratase HisB [Nitrospirota bacterium]